MASKKAKRRKVAAVRAAGVTRDQNSKKVKGVPPGRAVLHPCSCRNPGQIQDIWYGKGIRVHNVGRNQITCTVCGVQRYRTTTEPAAA